MSESAELSGQRYYFVCEVCNAKCFGDAAFCRCPRCGETVASMERAIPTWTTERRDTVRITRKSYEKARAVVEAAREQVKLVKAWEETVRRLGDLGSQELVAVTLEDDGGVRTECRLATAHAPQPTRNPTESSTNGNAAGS